MNILYLTSFIPKRNASQAGVNVTFDIIETIKNEYKHSNVDVAGLVNEDEFNELNNNKLEYINNNYFIPVKKSDKIKNIMSSLNKPLICSVRYDSRLVKLLKEIIIKNKYDYVLIDYTQNISYIDIIKNINSNIKVAIIEHDVSFLSYERKYKNSSNVVKKNILKFEYNRLLSYEKSALKKYDYIYTLNYKDRNLLMEFDNVGVLIPYFNRFDLKKDNHSDFNIMFWGAMNRKENEDAVMYFINEIWPSIKKDNVKFYIVGSKPSEKIKSLASDNIIVTGFVDDPRDYFNIMNVSVIPLRYGAGIKIKVLESLAGGIPVITSDVGAEGIDLNHGIHAYIANEAEDFIKYTNMCIEDTKHLEQMSLNGMQLINDNYNIDKNISSLRKFLKG